MVEVDFGWFGYDRLYEFWISEGDLWEEGIGIGVWYEMFGWLVSKLLIYSFLCVEDV